jgi:hypothetical protein
MATLFAATDNPTILAELETARRVNAERSASERRMGMQPLEQAPLALFLRTVIQALIAGLETGDRTCTAEGIALLQWLEVQVRLNEDDA